MNMAVVNGKIKGTMQDCLRHLSHELAKMKRQESYEQRQRIAEFIGLNVSSVNRLLKNLQEPLRLACIKLRYYLYHQGYVPVELEDLPQEVFELGNLLALKVATLSEIQELVKLTEDHLVVVLTGRGGTSQASLSAIGKAVEMFTQERGDVLQQRSIELCDSCRLRDEGLQIDRTSEQAGNASQEDDRWKENTLQFTAALIKATLPLAELISSDVFNQKDRARLRDLTRTPGSNGVFDLSNELNALCSETARKSSR